MTRKLFKNQNLFLQAMLTGIFDFYCFMSLSAASILPEGHKMCEKQNRGSIFLHIYQLINMKFDVVLKQFRLNILIPFIEIK